MKEYNISKNYAVLAKIDSHGSQTKFHKDGYWYKYDTVGCEGLAEELTSLVLKYSNCTDYVTYERCMINGIKGCRSKDFLHNGEDTLITFDRLYKNTYLCTDNLSERLFSYQNITDRITFLLDMIKTTTGLDATKYLYFNIALDMLIKNPDRHMNNLGVILSRDKFRFAPIFDNGQGLGCNFSITPPYMSHDERDDILTACTVSGSFEMAFDTIDKIYDGEKLQIDYEGLYSALESIQDSIAKSYLLYNLNKYERLFNKSPVIGQNEEEEWDR